MSDKIATLTSQMTLGEKAALCTGAGPWTTTPVERLGIPALIVSDGPHGVRRVANLNEMASQSLPATCFPTASCLSASWDTELLNEVGIAIGRECVAHDVSVILGPSNNMKRTPLCGRNFEYYAEDPYLSGQLATAFINGIQSQGVGTSLKHFAANNQEFQRFSISSEVDERTLREIYFPAFEKTVKDAQPWTVMCAYNKINGEYCSENYTLLTDILKNEWGFEGLVVSDWGAVHDRVASLEAGLDLEMPGPKNRRVQSVIDAVRSGKLSESILDEAVKRILRIVFKAAETPTGKKFDIEAHHQLVRKAAGEAMVLLKNDGVLPLQNVKRIAVLGRSAKEPHFQGGGSSFINTTKTDIPFEEIQKLSNNATLSYAEGYPKDLEVRQELIDEAVNVAKTSDITLIFVALPSVIESEGYDRTTLELTPQQVSLIKAVTAVQPKTVVILNNGSAITMSDWLENTAAVLESWMMGQAGGGAIADILFGHVNPSGKLAETFPVALADTPAYLNYPGDNGKVRYGEGLFIGYRYYDAKNVAVQFPFGHGLSYTSFTYSNLRMSSKTFKDSDGLELSLDITNMGKVAGKEIVQLYVHDKASKLVRPPKELKGFAKVALEPNETKTVSFKLDFRAFAYYHPGYKQWITEDGEFEILIGASATDIRLTETVTLHSTLQLPSLLNHESTLREWLDDARGQKVLAPMVEQMTTQMSAAMGAGGEQAAMGMDMMGFLMDLPLLSIFHFQEQMLPISPEQQVMLFLKEVHESKA
jgi:beta-glucosidase